MKNNLVTENQHTKIKNSFVESLKKDHSNDFDILKSDFEIGEEEYNKTNDNASWLKLLYDVLTAGFGESVYAKEKIIG